MVPVCDIDSIEYPLSHDKRLQPVIFSPEASFVTLISVESSFLLRRRVQAPSQCVFFFHG